MNARLARNLIAAMIVVLFWAILLITSGCVFVTYEADAQSETLNVKTLFKSIDGMWAERDAENGFSIVVDKTYTHDPMRGISELLSTIDELYGMGIRYDPNWQSPLMPEVSND